MKRIPCTLALLTRNSGSTLPKALEHAEDFAEILICDGRSTDNTIEIAEAQGGRVILQDQRYLDETGRLIDYSGPRNQLLQEAKYDWIFFLDSDEQLTLGLVAEIAETVESETETFVYLVPRKYVYEKKVIEAAISYPNRQYRFFHRQHVSQFTKRIHERIRFAETEVVGELKAHLLVPFHYKDVNELKQKLKKYIKMEIEEAPIDSLYQRYRYGKEACKRIIAQTVRLFTRRFFKTGEKLPLRLELIQIEYNIKLAIGWVMKR